VTSSVQLVIVLWALPKPVTQSVLAAATVYHLSFTAAAVGRVFEVA